MRNRGGPRRIGAGAPDCLYMSSSGKGQAGQVLARKPLGGFQVRGITATDEFDIPPRGTEIAIRAARTLPEPG